VVHSLYTGLVQLGVLLFHWWSSSSTIILFFINFIQFIFVMLGGHFLLTMSLYFLHAMHSYPFYLVINTLRCDSSSYIVSLNLRPGFLQKKMNCHPSYNAGSLHLREKNNYAHPQIHILLHEVKLPVGRSIHVYVYLVIDILLCALPFGSYHWNWEQYYIFALKELSLSTGFILRVKHCSINWDTTHTRRCTMHTSCRAKLMPPFHQSTL
jgi:hypothetical protein